MFDALAGLLNFFYENVYASYGVAIVLFTLTIMAALFPFTAKSMRSMTAMQRLQPEIKQLQAQHKNDRQALNEAMMALYKEHGVNPLSGCLPMLLQLPVFLVLYRILAGLTHTPGDAQGFVPKYLPETSKLYQDLHGETEMVSFGVDLARSASSAASVGFTTALPYVGLVGLTVVTGIWQQRQMTRRNANNPTMNDNPQAIAMQRVGKIMPIMFGVFSWTFPAGLVLYFVTSNVFRIGQQELLLRTDPASKAATTSAVVEAKAKPAKAKGGAKPATTKPAAGKPAASKPAATPSSQARGNGRQQPKKSRKGR